MKCTSIGVVVFDVGSTLIHPDYAALARWLLTRTGSHVLPATAERAFCLAVNRGNGLTSPSFAREARVFFNECSLQTIDDGLARSLWEEVVNAGGVGSWLYTFLDPDAHMTLKELKSRGLTLIAASNSDGSLIEELLNFDLLRYFDDVYDSARIGVAKPDERFYEIVLRSSKGLAALHVGDDLVKDYLAPRLNGFRSAILYDRSQIFEDLAETTRIGALCQLLGMIGRNESKLAR